MHSCKIFNCVTLKTSEPMRFAGTWKTYSKNAKPQLARIASHNALDLCFRCPYHAKVIKTLETINKATVEKIGFIVNIRKAIDGFHV